MTDLKVKIEQLLGPSNWPKWKWQMNMHFEQYEMVSIINGTRKCPVAGKVAEPTDAEQKSIAEWKRDNARAAALIASALSQSVANLVLTYTNANDIWNKLVSVYEQSSIQRLSLLMTEFFKLQRESDNDVAAYVAKVEKLFADMNAELRRRGSHDIPHELLHGQILATIGPEYQEFSNVWESLDDDKRTTNNLIEKLCTIEKRMQTACSGSETNAFVAHSSKRSSVTKIKTEKMDDIKKTNSNIKGRHNCFYCGKIGHIKKDCWKLKAERNKQEKNFSRESKTSNDGGKSTAFSATAAFERPDTWICDSGATHHMTANKQYFVSFQSFNVPIKVQVANKEKISAYGCGRVDVEMLVNGRWQPGYLDDVWYVPDIGKHLFSVQSATRHNLVVTMDHQRIVMQKKGDIKATGRWTTDAYKMDMRVVIPRRFVQVNVASAIGTLQLWHERFGHQDKRHVKHVLKKLDIGVEKSEAESFCDGCALGKAHRKPFRSRLDRSKEVGEVINADVNGPMSVNGNKNERYFVCFKDDFSKFRRIFFIKHKSEVSNCLRIFLNESFTAGHIVKEFRCDGGKEFDCEETRRILNERGITLVLSAPYTPEQNGAAERENRTIVELARTMMSVSNLPRFIWVQACETAVYLLNYTGKTPVDDKTPIELWNGRKIEKLDHLRVFGTECYVHIPKQFRKKFDNKSVFGKMVGYLNVKDGYMIYVPSLGKIVNSHDVYFKPEVVCSKVLVDVPHPEVTKRNDSFKQQREEVQSDESELENEKERSNSELQKGEEKEVPSFMNQRPKRVIRKPKWMTSGEFFSGSAYNTTVGIQDPQSYSEAMESDSKEDWTRAMQEELDALKENDAWELVFAPKDVKIIDNRWVLKTKPSEDERSRHFRARLVAKGHVQKAGMDYGETFSPVARYETVRALLAVAAEENLKLCQFDVRTAFLNGLLQEEVYMHQPEGFSDGSQRVCRLKRSLYGLKQSPRCWNQRLIQFMEKQELRTSSADPCLFIRQKGEAKLIVAVYVDDGLVAGSNQEEVDEFIRQLGLEFKITTSDLSNFLGMQIDQRT